MQGIALAQFALLISLLWAAAALAEKPEEEARRDPALSAKPGSGVSFRDCPDCPEMVVVPAGDSTMGSPPGEEGRFDREGPQHEVTIGRAFAVGKFEVTFAEWDACVTAGGCTHRPDDRGWGRGRRPVINVSWGDRARREYANYGRDHCCAGHKEGKDQWESTAPVGQFPANPFGLHDMHGNVWEWVEDCWHDRYDGAPADASAWTTSCVETSRVLRGGSWIEGPGGVRSAWRTRIRPAVRIFNYGTGFRLTRNF